MSDPNQNPEATSTAGATPAESAPKADLSVLLTEVVKMIVDHPEEVSAETQKHAGGIVLNLRVAQKDIGKVIGKQGKTIRSLRTLVDAASARQNMRCGLELIEEDEMEEDQAGEQ